MWTILIILLALIALFYGMSEVDRICHRYTRKAWHDQGRYVLGFYNTLLKCFSKRAPFLPKDLFPDHVDLEKHFNIIREEALNAYKQKTLSRFHDLDEFQERISHDAWKVLMFKFYGKEIGAAKKLCPKTTDVIQNIPQIHLAMLSILEKGKCIPPHYGPSLACYRYHLGISIPEGDKVYIIVGGKKYYWKNGEGVLFDDTYLHEVKNESEEPRIVLFCDVERQLSFPLNKLNHWMCKNATMSEYVRKVNAKAEKQFDAD